MKTAEMMAEITKDTDWVYTKIIGGIWDKALRGLCLMAIPSRELSSHVRIKLEDDGFFIEDIDSEFSIISWLDPPKKAA